MNEIKQVIKSVALAGVALALAWLGADGVGALWQRERAPSGGTYFAEAVRLPVPIYAQADARWGLDLLGPTGAPLAAEGCAVASAAMSLTALGCEIDPGKLNAVLQENGGFTQRGWLHWHKAAEVTGGKIRHLYEGPANYGFMDTNLLRGHPIIVRVRLKGHRLTHFVVVAGKKGYEYLVCDPGLRGARGLYPLSELGVPIQAVRSYAAVQKQP